MSRLLYFLQDTVSHGRAFVMAVAISVLVLSPVAEAAACGGEVETATSHSDSQLSESGSELPDKSPDRNDSGCVHGHCHHNAQPWDGNQQASAVWNSINTISFSWSDDQGPSVASDQLKRPPRA